MATINKLREAHEQSASAQNEMRMEEDMPSELDIKNSSILSKCGWYGGDAYVHDRDRDRDGDAHVRDRDRDRDGDAHALFDCLRRDTDKEGPGTGLQTRQYVSSFTFASL